MYDVSVILLIYNSEWKKIRLTLNSIIKQKNVDLEIIIADDGSENSEVQLVNEYLENIKIDYNIVASNENVGTVKNIIRALPFTSGKYVKLISPGDCLNGEDCLKNWIEYMESENADLSFCNAIYYRKREIYELIKKKSAPQNCWVYKKKKEKYLFVDYLLVNDSILGASVMSRRDIICRYLNEMNKNVKYAEDYMIRLLVFDQRKVCYLDKNLIWYEYGEGISTTKQKKWADILHSDFDAVNNIIIKRKNMDGIYRKYQRFLEMSKNKSLLNKVKKLCMFPSMLIYRFLMRIGIKRTAQDDVKYLNDLDIERVF